MNKATKLLNNYIPIIVLGMAVGLVDYIIKDYAVDWHDLPAFIQGWSWHTSMFMVYGILIVFFAWASGKWGYLFGIIAYINEDAFYYVFKFIFEMKFTYNSWLFESLWIYLFAIVIHNLIAVVGITITVKGGYNEQGMV